jgi:Family of unknown function (DUF6062)
MSTPFGYFDLIETFPQPGCAICRLLERDVRHYLDIILYEHSVDPRTQTDFRASRGLCHTHTWELAQIKGGVMAVATLYDAVLDEVMQITARTPAERQTGLARLLNNGAATALDGILAPDKPCPACVLREQSEQRYAQALAEYADDDRMRSAYEQSVGVCLPHFRAALRAAPNPEAARQLTTIQRTHWTKLKQELELFMHKMDAHYHQDMGAEGNSWLRVLARIAGEKHDG